MAGILVRQIVGFKHHDGKSELQYGVRSDGGGKQRVCFGGRVLSQVGSLPSLTKQESRARARWKWGNKVL